MRRALIATVMLATSLGVVALSACGSSSTGITEDASKQLELQVAAVRNAAAARDRAGAEQYLKDLLQTVTKLRDREEISKERETRVLAAAAAVQAQLESIPTTTTTTTTTTTLPPRAPDEDDEPGRGRNGGDGGNGGDDGGRGDGKGRD